MSAELTKVPLFQFHLKMLSHCKMLQISCAVKCSTTVMPSSTVLHAVVSCISQNAFQTAPGEWAQTCKLQQNTTKPESFPFFKDPCDVFLYLCFSSTGEPSSLTLNLTLNIYFKKDSLGTFTPLSFFKKVFGLRLLLL